MFLPSLCHSWGFSALPCSQKPPLCPIMSKVSSAHLAMSHFMYFLISSSLYEKCIQWCLRCVFRLPHRTACSALLTSLSVILTKIVVSNLQWPSSGTQGGNLQDMAVLCCPVNTQHTLAATITPCKIFSKAQVLWSAVRLWALLTYTVVWEWNFACPMVT